MSRRFALRTFDDVATAAADVTTSALEQRFGDLVSRHDPACESDQQAQDVGLERREFNRMSCPPNFPSLEIHLNVTEQFHRVGAVL